MQPRIAIVTKLLPCAAIVLACALVYDRLAGYDFVEYDDPLHIFANPHFNPLTWSGVAYFWTHAYEQLYIPVAYSVFALLCLIAQTPHAELYTQVGAPFNPHVFHIANIVLHTASALIVFCLLRRIVKQDFAALVGALVFALHPMQVESVAWVSELRGLLATLLCLASVLAYTRATRGSYALASVLFVLALLSKPSAVTLPPIVLAVDYLIDRRTWQRYALELGPWLLVAAALLIVTRSVQGVPAAAMTPLASRPLIAADALAWYAWKTIVPIHLAIDYGRSPHAVLLGSLLWAKLAIVIVALAPIALATRRWPWVGAAAVVWVAALLPVLGLVPFAYQYYSTVADRYAYLAMLGVSIAVASLLSRRPNMRALGLIPIVLGVLAFHQCGMWANTLKLMENEFAVNPVSVIGLVNLGNAFEENGRALEAKGFALRALRIDPSNSIAHMNLGNTLVDLGRPREALAEYDRAIAIEPGLRKAHYDRGSTLMKLGDNVGAIAEFDREIALSGYPPANINKGLALIELRRPVEAIAPIEQAIATGAPKVSWYTNLALAQAMAGRGGDARASIDKALALDPQDETALALSRMVGNAR